MHGLAVRVQFSAAHQHFSGSDDFTFSLINIDIVVIQ